jgi:hypothetical protein
MMSKQLAVSAAFSIFMMAIYVLFGGDAARAPVGRAAETTGPVEISAPALPELAGLLRFLR